MVKRTIKPTIVISSAIISVGVITALIFSLCGVWIPDIIFRQENTLLTAESKGGYKLKIIQVWGIDFYRTSGKLFMPDGQVKEFLIDPDSLKWWNCQCKAVIDENRTQITFGQSPGEKVVVYKWNTNKTSFIKPSSNYISSPGTENRENYQELQKTLYKSK